LTDHSAFICSIKQSKKSAAIILNTRNYLPSDTTLTPHRESHNPCHIQSNQL